jgi:hypothetical protein
MNRRRRVGVLASITAACLVAGGLAASSTLGGTGDKKASTSGCQLSSPKSKIKHVVYLQFDNTHYTRDNPSIASDLEQMPHLLNFLTKSGTLFTNDHTILISHTAGGILSTQTGLYPDRMGVTVSNSYFYFNPAKVPSFSTAFKYWTDLVDDTNGTADSLPNMVTDGQKTTPAPWVPFTRAGCDFGAVSLANIELENTGTGKFGDMTQVFGEGSPEWNEAKATPAKALADFVGIAVHCAKGGGICTSNAQNAANSRPDKLPDEPGGYDGYQALFGAKYVNPAINSGSPIVNSMFGSPITDPAGNPGFPGFDGALATNTLGYLAQMQEAGIPITWGYISDAHDNHTLARASGPGEADYVAQLKAYDAAFDLFFLRLKEHDIDQSNTLFIVTVDEGDKYAGGIGTPEPGGTLAYAHTNCAWTTTPACPSNQIGEVNLNLKAKLPTAPPFSLHRDSAPTFYVNGQPSRTDAALRKFERDVGNLQAIDPYVSSSPTPVFEQLADVVEEKTLHMVNSDPARTPSFTAFGNPDYFVTDVNPSCGSNPCIDYHFAWSHGDVQDVIANTWAGFVGPGVESNGVDSDTWTDHVNVRPTMLALLGLQDDYAHDGRVLTEALEHQAIPKRLHEHRKTTEALGDVYMQLNAPFGTFALDTLTASTRAILSTDEGAYNSIETRIENLTIERDLLASEIKAALGGAAFNDDKIKEKQAKEWIEEAQSLIDRAAALAAGP